MGLRIRQVKPDFWADPTLADLPIPTRLFYIGLWMSADDAGWLRWNAAAIAGELYRFESRHRREHRVNAMWTQLLAAGRVILHPCGHGHIPTLVRYQRFATPEKRVLTIKREHDACSEVPRRSPQVSAGPPASPQFPVTERRGEERNVEGGYGGDLVNDTAPDQWSRRVAQTLDRDRTA